MGDYGYMALGLCAYCGERSLDGPGGIAEVDIGFWCGVCAMHWQVGAWTARMTLVCRRLDWHPAALKIVLEHLGGNVRMMKLQVRRWCLRTILLGAPYHNHTPLYWLGIAYVRCQRDLIDLILEFTIPWRLRWPR